ncbi:SH3 domain-containing protein [Mesorhizobium shangrilense]|uniref:SH3 domain-containing protein n=1 Tax=Mesorhizobium shangrilense TaxID=460060 RepID=A0ABV2DMA1_9HYPH
MTLLLIGLGAVVLFVSGGHPESGSADSKIVALQVPTTATEMRPTSSSNAPITATNTTKQDQPETTTNPTVSVAIETPAAAQPDPIQEAAPSVGVGPSVSSASVSAEPNVVVLKTANVRSAPSLSGAVLVQLPAGTSLSVVEISGHWAKVRRGDDVLGWINQTLLDGAPEVPPATAYSQ